MIGPGWMPSRPRPMGRVRRLYTPGSTRRQPARRRRQPSTATAREPLDLSSTCDGGPIDLPTATVRPSRAHGRYLGVRQDLRDWLRHRWVWLRPRTIPLLVALASLFAMVALGQYALDGVYRIQLM